jgi:hypothetical protein
MIYEPITGHSNYDLKFHLTIVPARIYLGDLIGFINL